MTSDDKEGKVFKVHSIGRVERTGGRVLIRIAPEHRPALLGLDGFSHAQVLWWFDRFDEEQYRSVTQFEPPFDAPRLGVFASKAPMRPNPIALSTIPIARIDRDHGFIETPRIDAFDGTPVLDVKPYMPWYDRVDSAEVPSWARGWPDALPQDGIEPDQTPG